MEMSHISEMEKTPQTISFPCSLSLFFFSFRLIPEINEITPSDFDGSWYWSSSSSSSYCSDSEQRWRWQWWLVFLHRPKRGNADRTPSTSTGSSTAQILDHSHAQTRPLQTQMLQRTAVKEHSWRQLHRSSKSSAGKFVTTLLLNKSQQLLHMEAKSSSDKSMFVS